METRNEEKVFLVNGNVKEVGALLMEADDDGWVC
jgi:hypothetical protein